MFFAFAFAKSRYKGNSILLLSCGDVMPRCLVVTAISFTSLSLALLVASTCTPMWKEDLDIYKGLAKSIGLWQACIKVDGDSVSGFPAYDECDKDFLRPQLIEPPNWFQAVRVMMILACLLTLVSLMLFATAFFTDNSKRTGSSYWPAGTLVLFGGLLALISLVIFTVNAQMSIKYAYSAGRYFALYWQEEPTKSIVNGVFFKIETWFRYSYGLGWSAVVMALFAFVTAVLTDLTNKRKY